ETVWEADRETLTPGNPVTLSWTNPAGIVFEQELAIDENYLFTVTQRVTNGSEEPLAIRPYGRVWRYGTPVVEGWFILHEGPIGVFDSTLDELDYEDIAEEGTITETSTGGWLGFTDKYWLVSLVPDQASAVEAQFIHTRPGSQDRYASTIAYDTVAVAAGESHEMTSRLFAGAKEVDVIDAYQEVYGIDNFIYSIDWGWFYFITQPFFYAIDWIASHVGNFGVAILIFTVLVKLVFFPLANKSYKSMSRMKALQPQMMQIRERFKDDRQKMNQALMEMYRREKVNPASGCLPILVQIPVFFALYKVLFVTIEMRHAPFFGWIQDLAAMDPTSLWNLFGLIPWEPETVLPPFLLLPAWPIFMGVTMWAQMKLNPAPTDPIQKRIIGAFPFVFTFLLSTFPAGLVIYWTWNNMLSMLQQYVIMKRMGVKIGGGVDKTAPATQPNLPPSVRRKQERAKKAQEGDDAAPAPEPANDSQARRGQSGKRKRR
ncbi:MAG: membrane protein insertase YidC, partial [Azospirillaceae bacterium]